MKKLAYKCPSCNQLTLAVDAAGFLVCTLIGCKDPGKIHEIISDSLIAHADIEIDDLVDDEVNDVV